ncbi:MAG: hypothetical protein SFV54_25140 [Bryobacteraceae bacterium]|nr:hypothetical protein [Bryobacteraceae bacterium]
MSLADKEALARAAIEARVGRALSGEEWVVYRERLLSFVLLLARWQESRLPKDLR